MDRFSTSGSLRNSVRSLMVIFASVIMPETLGVSTYAATISPGDILVGALSDNGYTPGVIRVDPVTGNRNFVSGGGVGSGPEFGGVAGLSLQGQSTLYVSDLELRAVLQVDLATGDRTIVSGTGVGTGDSFVSPEAIWRENANSLLVVDRNRRDGSVYRVDMTTGNRSLVTSATRGTGPAIINPGHAITLPNGDILLAIAGVRDDGIDGAIYRVDPATGDRTIFSGKTRGAGDDFVKVMGLTLTPSGEIYAVDNWDARIYRVDPVTGDRTMVANGIVFQEPSFVSPFAVAEESPGKLIFTDHNYSEIFRADAATITHTLFSSDAEGYGVGPSLNFPYAIAVVQVPEPASVWLAAAAIALLMAARRQDVDSQD